MGKTEWTLRDAPPHATLLKAVANWQPAGVIAGVITPKIAQALRRLRVPVVDTANVLPQLRFPIVDIDPNAVGRMAAEYFLERNYSHLGFFGSQVAVYSRLQEAAFTARIKEAGRKVYSCYYEYLPEYAAGMIWQEASARMRQWLQRLPKPVAIFCCEDALARILADTCVHLSLRVPEDVALLGCGNDDLECTLSEPTISSIAVPAERVGFEAAALLDRLMAGEPAPAEPILLPPVGVITRRSTDLLAIEDELIRQAVSFVRENALKDIRVGDVSQALAVSRRLLERRFRAVLGRTILQEIYRIRVERAKVLLAQTHLPISMVAHRCGFSSPRHLDVRFRKIVGITPRAFRRQYRAR
jgi:LacI family transcriptional regulator